MSLVYALLSAVFAALVAIFAKLGLKNLDSTLATFLRSVVMALFLAAVVLITNKLSGDGLKNLTSKDILLIILSGIAGAVSWIFYFLALKTGDENTSKVAAVDRLSIIFVLIFSVIFLKEKLELSSLIGIVLIAVGGIIVALF